MNFNNENVDNSTPRKKQDTGKKCKCGSTDHRYTSNLSCTLNKKRIESIENPIERVKKPCKCGSYDHAYTKNKKFILNNLTCNCGSKEHTTTRHSSCPLNNAKNCIDPSVESVIDNLISQTRNPFLIQAREILTNE